MEVFEKMVQGSEEWFAVRKGRATASEFKEFLSPSGALSLNRSKDGISGKAHGYICKLIGECLSNESYFDWQGNKYTEWGQQWEPTARYDFQRLTGTEIDEVGFCVRDDRIIGCSPDGLITANGERVGGLEIKCPTIKTHIEYHAGGKLPDEYKLQVHGGMAVTGFKFWYFMSFFPGVKPFVIRVDWDETTDSVCQGLDDFVIEYARAREELIPMVTKEAQYD